jgi:hypothetical protein|tara:strand:+ start:264 stop:419 length:156 start_codon:yes stop_codon:yes gene_type:complete
MIRTPKKPLITAIQRLDQTASPMSGPGSSATNSDAVKRDAMASARGGVRRP